MAEKKTEGPAKQAALPVSESKTLEAALLQAQRLITAAEKDSTNQYSRYSYASAECIMDLARRALHAVGLVPVADLWELEALPEFLTGGGLETGTKYSEMATCICAVTCEILHPASGDRRSKVVRVPVHVHDGMPLDKAASAANTLALRYWLRNLLVIPQVESGADINSRNDAGYQAPRARGQQQRKASTQAPPPQQVTAGSIGPNQKPGTCVACKAAVKTGEGWQKGSRTDRVRCDDCLQAGKAEALGVPEELHRLVKDCPGCGKHAFDPKGNDGQGCCYACGWAGEQGGGDAPSEPEPGGDAAEAEEEVPDGDVELEPNKVGGPCNKCKGKIEAGEGKQDRDPVTKRVRRWCQACLANA